MSGCAVSASCMAHGLCCMSDVTFAGDTMSMTVVRSLLLLAVVSALGLGCSALQQQDTGQVLCQGPNCGKEAANTGTPAAVADAKVPEAKTPAKDAATSASNNKGSQDVKLPDLDEEAQSVARSVDVVLDTDFDKGDFITKNKDGQVQELSSLSSLTQFWLSSGGAESYPIAKNEGLTISFDIKQTTHQGEMQIIDEVKSPQKLILTVETIAGQTLASYDLLRNRTFAYERVADISFDVGIPDSTEMVPGFVFICVDADNDKSCSDEKVKNLNFYLNFMFAEDNPAVQPTGDSSSTMLDRLFGVDLTSNDAFFFQPKFLEDAAPKGVLIFSQAVTIDPVLGRIKPTKPEETAKYLAADTATLLDEDKREAVSKINALVLAMTSSYDIEDAGAEVAGPSIGSKISISLADYCALCDPTLAYGPGTEVSAGGNSSGSVEDDSNTDFSGGEVGDNSGNSSGDVSGSDDPFDGSETGGGTGNSSGDVTGPQDDLSTAETGDDIVFKKPGVVYRDGSIYCHELCSCTPQGTPSCNKPGTIYTDVTYKCASACGCVWNETSESYLYRCNATTIRSNGCFAAGTRIAIENRKTMPVELLLKGMSVVDGQGEVRQVSKVVVGPEKEKIIAFRVASGEELRVSALHPMFTARGVVAAKDVRVADHLLAATGGYREVLSIERIAYSGNVYNIVLDGPNSSDDAHQVVANGLVTGDLLLQQRLSPAPQSLARR